MLDRARFDTELKSAHPANFIRYAIYYTPQPGTPLAAFGRSWFGRANDGATLQAFSDTGLAGAATVKPPSASSRYSGLHAVFKAPFCLRDGMGPDALKARLISFASRRKQVETGPLTLARAGRYLVLRPIKPTPALDWLAAQCVAAFDGFAKSPPCTHAQQGVPLNDHQRLLLKSFGDPHVLSEYRFYITLTGPLEAAHLERVSQALWPMLEEICASGVTVDGLSLVGEFWWPRAAPPDPALPARSLKSRRVLVGSENFRVPGEQSFDTWISHRDGTRLGDSTGESMPDYGEILAFLAANPPQLSAERELHASLLELLAQCLRSEQVTTDGEEASPENLEAHHFRWVNFN